MRTLVVWCPDWPVVAAAGEADLVAVLGHREAAEIDAGQLVRMPVAVLAGGTVMACSPAARADGVRRGLRRREAQARCPDVVLLAHDPARDARAFEPVAAAVAALAPGVEVIRPGVCALAARGPASYFGGEAAAAERLVDAVADGCGVECQVGVADGVFAARHAARAGAIVPPGRSAEFLAGLDVALIELPDLVDLLRRLGVRTLGQFAALPAGDVLARFGYAAALAHRYAAGRDERPLAVRQPPPDLDVAAEPDPPVERVDTAAFLARPLAERLHERLAGHGLACTRLTIEALTGNGEPLARTWRHDGLLGPAEIADRVRWQLDGWLTGTHRPTAGIIRLRLVPDGVVVHAGLQLGLWGDAGEDRDRAHRAMTRVQGLLGPESVLTAMLGGGRSPADRVRLVPWGDERTPTRPGATLPIPMVEAEEGKARRGLPPWPGQLPPPAPATVYPEPLPAAVHLADGNPVGVTGRGMVTGPPAVLIMGHHEPAEATGVTGVTRGSEGRAGNGTAGCGGGRAGNGTTGAAGGRAGNGTAGATGGRDGNGTAGGGGGRAGNGAQEEQVEIVEWAGPWPVDERWWAGEQARRLARFQVCLADGRALLLAVENGRWWVEAEYD